MQIIIVLEHRPSLLTPSEWILVRAVHLRRLQELDSFPSESVILARRNGYVAQKAYPAANWGSRCSRRGSQSWSDAPSRFSRREWGTSRRRDWRPRSRTRELSVWSASPMLPLPTWRNRSTKPAVGPPASSGRTSFTEVWLTRARGKSTRN